MTTEATGTPDGPPAGFREGVPCWVDAQLPDVAAGRRFYGELFGWTFDETEGPEAGRYVQAYGEGRPVAALAPKRDGRMPTVWTVYLATADARATAARIKDAGGQLVTEPVRVGPAGTMALAADPEGAVFGLWQGDEHPGFGKQREPDSYCWTEVYSRDKALVDPFYEDVFGFDALEIEEAGVPFRIWSPAGTEAGPETAVGGRSLVTGEFAAEMPGHFLVYFSVTDCDATVAATRRLGGRVRVEPLDTPFGRMAVLADDQRAVFAVLEEPVQGSVEDPSQG
ncbi:VOC family protein [Streptomyces triticagri]|uniref:VOC family protein n=1 Tax=Streptomyces triticagri TaxID=2293568 RepID=A0A372LZ58_9ACTN|nr:VOC family protein [Streptomyces triticagri]RFU83849.1 VOC family protein [Streptomyces triticagri]